MDIQKLQSVEKLVGNTPIIELNNPNFNLFMKLEGYNLSGSIKDRPALHIIKNGILDGTITQDTTIIESSSGNFAIALATICKLLDIRFIAVIDPHINAYNEQFLRVLCTDVVKVKDKDHTGGYLLSRIATVKNLVTRIPDSFWPNQYENPLNAEAHYLGTADEICREFDHIDYLFVAVSSCGTLAGVSKRFKEKFPDSTLVAVDAEGSMIFSNIPKSRPIPGLGSSMKSQFSRDALFDDVAIINEHDIIDACTQLLNQHGLFLGGSSGACYAAIKKFEDNALFTKDDVVVSICPDRGNAYINNIYNEEWVATLPLEEVYSNVS